MIIPCPLIKSIYLSSIRDRRPPLQKKKEKGKKEAISQSGFGRHHLAGMRQLDREEVLGCWNINTDTVWVKVTSLNLISCSSQAFFLPVLYITVNIFFLLWLRAGLFSKREPNGLRRSQRNCLSCPSAEGSGVEGFLPSDLAQAVFARRLVGFV